MSILLFCFSAFALVAAVAVATVAKSAIHEIEALILFLISALFFTGMCICACIENVKRLLKKQIDDDKRK